MPKVSTIVRVMLLLTIIAWLSAVESTAVVGRRNQQRQKRTAVISLPRSNGMRWTQQIWVPVLAMINQTNTYLLFDCQIYTSVPTAANLNTLYSSIGRANNRHGIEIDEEFVEEQRSNSERRTVYQYIEGFFSK